MPDPVFTWTVIAGIWLVLTWRSGYDAGRKAEARRRAAAAPPPPPPASLPPWRPPDLGLGAEELSPTRQAVLDELVVMGFPRDVARRAVMRTTGDDPAAIREGAARSMLT